MQTTALLYAGFIVGYKEKQMAKRKIDPTPIHTLSPKAQVLLEELSKELKLSKEVVAKLAVMMYRLYKDKR